jgi:hypothetical protein
MEIPRLGCAIKIVRIEGEHIYVETVISEDQQKLSTIFRVGDLAKKGNIYVGTENSRWPCKNNICSLQNQIEIQVLTPNRIEGIVTYPGEKMDCGSCKWTGAPGTNKFVWIPE